MRLTYLIGAALVSVFTLVSAAPSQAQQSTSQLLRVSGGDLGGVVSVVVGRSIVLDSSEPFAEVSVANPAVADVAALSDTTLFILGRQAGRTSLTVIGEGNRVLANAEIRVTPDVSEFKERLFEILPGEQIEVRTAADGIVLSGRLSGARKVTRAIELANRYAPNRVTNLMTVGGTQQVMLKVRFADMSRGTAKQLGFNFFGALQDNPAIAFGTGAGLSVNSPDVEGGITIPVGDNSVNFAQSTFGILGIGGTIGDVLLAAQIDANESKGLIRTLAEPNLVTLSGDTASFLAGGEVPIPVDAGDSKISVEFKPFGVGLSFTPTVVDEDLINLELNAEVSAPAQSGAVIDTDTGTIPSFTTRRAETTVELRDGQSMAIAGLLQDFFVDNISQVPWLGDLPVIGPLFRNTDFDRQQRELVIIITPHLVTPVDGNALTTPLDRVAIPNEAELFLLGRTESPAAVQEIASQNFDGPYGYVVK